MSTFKHGLIAIPLTLAALAVIPAADNGANPTPGVNPPGATPHDGTANTATNRAINTIDPVNGRPVDPSVQTLSLSATGQAATAGAAGTVVIGFSDKSSRDTVEKAQGKDKEMYISAARQNRVVKDGRIGDGKASDGRMNPDGSMQHDDKTRKERDMDPAQPTGPNQRGDGMNDPTGANPGTKPDNKTRPTDTVPAR